jgi:hypothetical protein
MDSKLDQAFRALSRALHEAHLQVVQVQEACSALHFENVELRDRIEKALVHLDRGATGLAIQALSHKLPE